MALVVGQRAVDQPAYKAWLFRTRPLFLPTIALAVWILYSVWLFPILTTPFWGNLRWVVLVALALQGLLEIWKWGGQTPISLPIIGLLLFSLATFASATYSIIPLLSLYKAISFLLGLMALVFGIGLRHRGRPNSWLRLLASVNLVIAGISLLLILSPSSFDGGLFRGPFVNPNSLGSSLVLTFPALLWIRELHVREAPLLFRSKLLTAIVFLEILMIFLSRSRASLLALALVLTVYAALRASRFAWLIVYGMVVLLLATPTVASQVGRQTVYKGRDPGAAFTTRVDQLTATLEAAQSRPISGYGFGTSADHTTWDGSLSAVGAGREKSNTYLAAVEEVGLVGAVPLFLGLVAALLMGLRAARRAKWTVDGTPAALVAIIAAALVNANFEAWLTAIGSFEGLIFWATLGVLLMNVRDRQVSAARAEG